MGAMANHYQKLIEGRKPNLFIAKPVAQQLDQKTAINLQKQ